MVPDQTDILIVGAGPTGLALAVALQKAEVDHVLIDTLEAGRNTSRAAVVHPHTLEMLDTIGAAGSLSAKAIALTNFTVRDRDRPLLQMSFATLPSTFRHMLMVPQSTTEAVLEARLNELGGKVNRGVTAQGIVIDERGAIVRVNIGDGEQDIRARYIVGADGMHSTIREAADIPFRGSAYSESFVLADVRMDWALGAEEVSFFFSPAGLVVVAPLPGGSYRIVATLDDAPERPSVADIQQLLDARGPVGQPARVTHILWSSRFRVQHRLVDRYRSGPILLMGDAAHVHSPAGGQGMNTGLIDAVVLGQALARVMRDGEPDSVLDDYARTRRPAARQVLTLASRLTVVATLRAWPARWLRNLVVRSLDHWPPFKRALGMGLSGLARRRFSVLPGKRA